MWYYHARFCDIANPMHGLVSKRKGDLDTFLFSNSGLLNLVNDIHKRLR